ncbi:MAG TPA: hypothetical protein VFF36_00055, partial [Planctomycetota bacterium]|nr:hypothetical protein [Planctomycetota bacterium]
MRQRGIRVIRAEQAGARLEDLAVEVDCLDHAALVLEHQRHALGRGERALVVAELLEQPARLGEVAERLVRLALRPGEDAHVVAILRLASAVPAAQPVERSARVLAVLRGAVEVAGVLRGGVDE